MRDDTHEDVARVRALNKRIDWTRAAFLVHMDDAFHWLDATATELTAVVSGADGAVVHSLVVPRGGS